ncbi:universal stress protein (plasmid) [Halorussus salilacus]|uniref:universal stress protein n=1 Tax=Halorussus salilacus TaxID=2953750 RepID=UPI00209DFA4C|nr:universal stress protein [Halorussus salilacus]USZ69809.1 universal stress protein [Halorussus salilacus]
MYERILVPTDGSDAVDPAIEQAIDLAETYGAELHALYVVNTGTLSVEVNTASVLDALEAEGERATREVAERAAAAGVERVRTEVVHGMTHQTILEYAEDEDVDLVVMGTHGRSGLDRYLLGSVTEKVVRKSDVPVLTVRKPESDEAAE